MKTNYLLTGCVLLLVVLCFLSVNAPLRFDHERQVRETEVKTRLVAIRQAEERYCQRHGTYTGDFNALVKGGLLADSLRYIPNTRKPFSLRASGIMGKTGRQIPVMECGARYDEYLQGLDADEVSDLTDEAMGAGRFPGLKIGDLETPNNNAGNWE